MTATQKAQRKTLGFALDRILDYVEKDPEKNLVKLVGKTESLVGGIFPKKYFEKLRAGAEDSSNVWNLLARSVIDDVDRNIVKRMLLAFGLGAGYHGTSDVRSNREKLGCNIPWIILLDPTNACNLKCKGCWSAEYSKSCGLSYEEMDSVITQGVELGTHVYMFTGGEPLVRKHDILRLCDAHPDCVFLAYTNATLIDEEFCVELRRVGNLALAVSAEGDEKTNDSRRGEGNYKRVMNALNLLKEYKCFYGISVCYTRENIPSVTSDEFLNLMLENGVKFGFYFNYMPVGHDAVPELIPTPDQREYMYSWLRKVRDSHGGKPMFIFDFQNDAEYVGGCIAGGRNYFHINASGDIEPCVFVHFSDSNIRTHTLLEALRNPLFQEFWKGQPFNDNHLRPCPMLENPDKLRAMVAKTGAKSTDFLEPESADMLCSKCDAFAAAWAPQAEKLWSETKHPTPKTQYYRDMKKQ